MEFKIDAVYKHLLALRYFLYVCIMFVLSLQCFHASIVDILMIELIDPFKQSISWLQNEILTKCKNNTTIVSLINSFEFVGFYAINLFMWCL